MYSNEFPYLLYYIINVFTNNTYIFILKSNSMLKHYLSKQFNGFLVTKNKRI